MISFLENYNSLVISINILQIFFSKKRSKFKKFRRVILQGFTKALNAIEEECDRIFQEEDELREYAKEKVNTFSSDTQFEPFIKQIKALDGTLEQLRTNFK